MMGDIMEFISNAGKVESIPAINIHSPCLLVVLKPKYSFEVDHHAKTGVEKPTIQAGNAMIRNNATVMTLTLVTSSGAINMLETKVPTMKINHNCLTLGISNGDVLWIRWCCKTVGPGDCINVPGVM